MPEIREQYQATPEQVEALLRQGYIVGGVTGVRRGLTVYGGGLYGRQLVAPVRGTTLQKEYIYVSEQAYQEAQARIPGYIPTEGEPVRRIKTPERQYGVTGTTARTRERTPQEIVPGELTMRGVRQREAIEEQRRLTGVQEVRTPVVAPSREQIFAKETPSGFRTVGGVTQQVVREVTLQPVITLSPSFAGRVAAENISVQTEKGLGVRTLRATETPGIYRRGDIQAIIQSQPTTPTKTTEQLVSSKALSEQALGFIRGEPLAKTELPFKLEAPKTKTPWYVPPFLATGFEEQPGMKSRLRAISVLPGIGELGWALRTVQAFVRGKTIVTETKAISEKVYGAEPTEEAQLLQALSTYKGKVEFVKTETGIGIKTEPSTLQRRAELPEKYVKFVPEGIRGYVQKAPRVVLEYAPGIFGEFVPGISAEAKERAEAIARAKGISEPEIPSYVRKITQARKLALTGELGAIVFVEAEVEIMGQKAITKSFIETTSQKLTQKEVKNLITKKTLPAFVKGGALEGALGYTVQVTQAEQEFKPTTALFYAGIGAGTASVIGVQAVKIPVAPVKGRVAYYGGQVLDFPGEILGDVTAEAVERAEQIVTKRPIIKPAITTYTSKAGKRYALTTITERAVRVPTITVTPSITPKTPTPSIIQTPSLFKTPSPTTITTTFKTPSPTTVTTTFKTPATVTTPRITTKTPTTTPTPSITKITVPDIIKTPTTTPSTTPSSVVTETTTETTVPTVTTPWLTVPTGGFGGVPKAGKGGGYRFTRQYKVKTPKQFYGILFGKTKKGKKRGGF